MMNSIHNNHEHFTPKFGPCDDFSYDNNQMKKIIWLVPHVIKYKDESELIIWRCNWGNMCESKCLYATARRENTVHNL